MSIEERVSAIAAAHFGIPLAQITFAGRLDEDYNFDSLDRVEFAMALEEEFQCFLDDEKVGAAQTLQDYVTAIEAELQ